MLADASPTLLVERGARLVVQGSGPATLADPFREIARAAPTAGRVRRAVRPGDGPQDLRRRRLLRDAVAVRAVRTGPDDRAPLRDAADRPSRRRAGRHRRRRVERIRAAGRVSRSTARRSSGLLAACEAAMRLRARGWAGLGRPARSRDGGRLRLGDGVGAALRRGVPAGRGDPGAAATPTPARRARGAAPLSSRRGASVAARAGRLRG